MTNTTGIIMGVGAPNLCRDGRKTMCAIILSEELGLIRVYPIPANAAFPVWGQVNLTLTKSNSDPRHESYKLESFEVVGCIVKSDQKREILNRCIIKSGTLDPLDYCNQNKSSIALVKIKGGTAGGALDRRALKDAPPSPDEEQPWIQTQADAWVKPLLKWTSDQDGSHNTHLVGREVYMGISKNPTAPFNIFNNMQTCNPDFEHWLLLGNIKSRRNVFVGVHLHRLKKQIGGSTLPFLEIQDGRSADWPYSKQEALNVPTVDDQLLLFTTPDTTSVNSHGNIAMTA
tara:strand:- start:2913 stop:3773 length:861 start_codon:yes stop_codon:yes gene_type:complete